MRYTSIDQVVQGELLGKHIFASDGRILLNEGVQLTVGLLSKLRRMGVHAVYIKDEHFSDVEVEEVVSETTKREAITVLSQSFQYMQHEKGFDPKAVNDVSKKLVDEIFQNRDVLVTISDIRTNDNELFVHSVNVCILSVIVGMHIGLERKRIEELATGALLHDIGKILPNIQEDKLSLQEQEQQNDHTWKGFHALRKLRDISTLSAHIALTHHENVDGSGYPRQLQGDEIHFLSKIVAVANYYDHLISTNGERGLHPYEACERIMGLTNIYFDHNVVWKFLRAVAFYPTGSQVKLTTGETGIVVGQHRGLPQRPIVRTFTLERNSYSFDDFEVSEVDLAKETTVFIKEII